MANMQMVQREIRRARVLVCASPAGELFVERRASLLGGCDVASGGGGLQAGHVSDIEGRAIHSPRGRDVSSACFLP